ncbi:MAG TPA: hypothetical protein VIV40_12755 [Kofleriaceae bacterium]
MTCTRALVIAFLLAPALAHADDEIVRGTIVKIEAQEIYLNVGVDRGVNGGATVRLKRPISLRHPVTRAQIQDWIPIGSASVTQAGAVLSRAVVGELVGELKVGDVAEVLVDRPDRAPTQTAQQTAQPGGAPPVDQATAEVLGVFAAQAGQPLDARIASWERYLSTRGNSPYADAIKRDLDQLHTLRDELQPHNAKQSSETLLTLRHDPPKVAPAGSPIPVVFVLDQPERVASAYLHYRVRGNRTYRSVLLVREHDIYLRGAVPAEVVTTAGVDYFVEASTAQGQSGLALGTPLEPVAVTVTKPSLIDTFGSAPGRSSVKLAIDYLDFARLETRSGDRTDYMVTANVDFTYRLNSAVESLGVGYGVYSGKGGSANMEWTDASLIPKSGFHYGYADIEIGGRTEGVHVSGGGALIAGVGRDGFGMGGEGRFRVGDRDGTNLALIARTVSEVGFLSDIKFTAKPAQSFLIGVSVGATDQPNKGDVGVKLGTELEVLAIKNVSLLLRGSWQGRNTMHGGLGAGGGLGFYW